MTDGRIKIAMFGHKHMWSREGGIEIVVNELATRMAVRGHQVVCYDRSAQHISRVELDWHREYQGVKSIPVWTIDKKGIAAMTSSLSAAWRSAWSKADVVHVHAEGPAAMCWIPKISGKQVVVTIHGLDWQRAKWSGLARKYIKFGEETAVRQADEIIVLSRSVQEYFSSVYGRATVFIPNGVSRPTLQKANKIKALWGLKKDSYVLFLGRIVPEKGLRCLIDAWKGISTDKKLVIAGGTSDTHEFLGELKNAAGENVIFTGFQQGRVLEELYSNSYIYCLPSDLEGMPLSLLEAMSYGNCCLVSDIPECVEVVEDKAAVFKKSDSEDLRRILRELLDMPERVAEYRKSAANFICGKYNWEDVVDRTLKLYQRLLRRQ